jgi:hypothetical protein
MSTATNEGKALSADASSFNPPSSDQIWGAISQSYAFPDGGAAAGAGAGGTTPTENMTAGAAVPPRHPQHSNNVVSAHNHRSSHHQYASSSPGSHNNPHGGAGVPGGENSKAGLGSLWNFGGFGDDAKNRSAAPQARGGMLDDSNVNLDFMRDHGNKVRGRESTVVVRMVC